VALWQTACLKKSTLEKTQASGAMRHKEEAADGREERKEKDTNQEKRTKDISGNLVASRARTRAAPEERGKREKNGISSGGR